MVFVRLAFCCPVHIVNLITFLVVLLEILAAKLKNRTLIAYRDHRRLLNQGVAIVPATPPPVFFCITVWREHHYFLLLHVVME